LIAQSSILGVVLAGGRSTRMGTEKALIEFGGKPLIAHAVARLSPQVDAVAINANGDPTRFASLGLSVVADAPAHRGLGPLAGIAAALALAEAGSYSCVLTVPCDAPFAPLDLASRLAAAMGEASAAGAEGPRGLEPLFALWRSNARSRLERALESGERSPRDFLAACNAIRVPFAAATGVDPFANLNDRGELAAARARLSS
jgi:molybdenum cofactor guanylyltransferase